MSDRNPTDEQKRIAQLEQELQTVNAAKDEEIERLRKQLDEKIEAGDVSPLTIPVGGGDEALRALALSAPGELRRQMILRDTMIAESLHMDKAPDGGRFIVNDRVVNANGEPIEDKKSGRK